MKIALITPNKVNDISSRYGFDVKMHKGEITRACACSIVALHALEQGVGVVTPSTLDDICYNSFGFALSHRKGEPTKDKGGLSFVKRIMRYLKGDAKHSPYSASVASLIDVSGEGHVSPCPSFERALKALSAQKERDAVVHVARERATLIRKGLVKPKPITKGSGGLPASLKAHLGIKS